MSHFTPPKIFTVAINLLIATLTVSCDYYDSSNAPAAYLIVDSTTFATSQSTYWNDHRINHINVYVRGQFLGGYTLPARIPITALGRQNVSILAGISADGITDARVEYPFFEVYRDTLTFQEGQSIRVLPRFSYVNYLEDPAKVDANFEGESLVLDTLSTKNALTKLIHGLTGFPYSGANYGETRAETGDTALLQLASKGFFQETLGNSPIYLEFEYKSNIAIIVGILVYTNTSSTQIYSSIYDLYLRPNSNWTKIYCDLTQELQTAASNTNSGTLSYKVFFRGVTDGTSSQFFALDNVRYIK